MQILSVRQLIEVLKLFPLDIPVVVDGYEGGYGRITDEMVTMQQARRTQKGSSNDSFPVVRISREGSPDQEKSGLFHSLEINE